MIAFYSELKQLEQLANENDSRVKEVENELERAKQQAQHAQQQAQNVRQQAQNVRQKLLSKTNEYKRKYSPDKDPSQQ